MREKERDRGEREGERAREGERERPYARPRICPHKKKRGAPMPIKSDSHQL